MKNLYRFLIGLHLFVGLGALAGGLAGILNPINPMGAPVEMLKGSPFSDFLIPGIILFTVIGIGNIIAGIAVYARWKFHGLISGVFNAALVIWIVVQCIMINAVAALHIIFFIIGVVGGILSLIILFKQQQFPATLVLDFYKKVNKEA